jgi:hypothetical protein
MSSLRGKISATQSLGAVGEEYLEGMLSLLSLLLELRTLPLGPEYEDERTIATIELMEYLKRTDRMETYIKYVEMLVQNHCKSSNFVEAGFTLLLHGQMLAWEDTMVDSAADFPRQSARERKVCPTVFVLFVWCFFFVFVCVCVCVCVCVWVVVGLSLSNSSQCSLL